MIDSSFAVAPMIDVTDRHFRYMCRLLTRRAVLWSEMITAAAVLHGDRTRLLEFDAFERPTVLQLGGSEPEALGEAARVGVGFGYDELNLNVGCPSARVQSGRFGACLMREPARVAACVRAMQTAGVPVSVKCRIGVDDDDPEQVLPEFLERIFEAGAAYAVVHARKALLSGLSPADNRRVPPLRYDLVLQMKERFPGRRIVLNGGLDFASAGALRAPFDGVMLGRAVQADPWLLRGVDADFYGETAPPIDETTFTDAFAAYIERRMSAGAPFYAVAKHTLNLFRGRPGAARRRRLLSEEGPRPGAGVELFQRAALL